MSKQQTPFDGQISYALAAAHRLVNLSLTEQLKAHGVQLEAWRIMECLGGDTRLTMGELAKLVLINPPALSKLVDRMVANGLVHRQMAQKDQRQVNLLLTDFGRKKMMSIRDDVKGHDQSLVEKLDIKGKQQLFSLLGQLTE